MCGRVFDLQQGGFVKSTIVVANLTVVVLLAAGAWASTETVLYSFTGGSDGGNPQYGTLARDSSGNLVGTTEFGGGGTGCGGLGCGTVFELMPNSDGSWNETVLYTFQGTGDGAYPTAGVVLDPGGNIYGTTNSINKYDCGTVFRLSGSTLTTLHSFHCGGNEGYGLFGGVIRDKSGNLYGTAYAGGKTNNGIAYEISSSGSFRVIHTFCLVAGCRDGANPYSPLVIDKEGDLLGTTGYGGHGSCNCGTVFKLLKSGSKWKETVLRSFDGSDGAVPEFASLTLGTVKSGSKELVAIFGVTTVGGSGTGANGTVFEMIKARTGYKLTVLHSFPSTSGDGYTPYGTLTYLKGKLFGTTIYGGSGFYGTVFELEHTKSGWKETVVNSFCAGGWPCSDGDLPFSGMIADSSGDLYGTTSQGGGVGFQGLVYKLTP
jgi:uncharacterized repeat protein (TIGR03803 family)